MKKKKAIKKVKKAKKVKKPSSAKCGTPNNPCP